MRDGSAAIAQTVRAGFSDLAPSLRACWAALLVAGLISVFANLLLRSAAVAALPLEAAAAVIAWGALYRRALCKAGGVAGLRWGMDEWRLLGAQALILVVLAVVVAVLSMVVAAIVLGVARAAAPNFDATSSEAWRMALSSSSLGAVVAGAAPLLGLGVLAWLSARLCLAVAASVDQERIRVLSAFPLTHGLAWHLVAVSVIVGAPVVAALVILGLLARWVGPGLDGLRHGVGAAILYLYLAPVWTAALVHVYRRRWTPEETAG